MHRSKLKAAEKGEIHWQSTKAEEIVTGKGRYIKVDLRFEHGSLAIVRKEICQSRDTSGHMLVRGPQDMSANFGLTVNPK